jgi:class 3 adenylate cyclase
VVEAARLVAAARPGQILVTQIARALAGARCSAAFVDLGLLELKGLPEPVAVCEVGWQPAGSSVPMPRPAHRRRPDLRRP